MKIIATLILICLSSLVYSQTITSTSTGGNWNVAGTWAGGVVPTSTADVVIADEATVTITSNQTCASLQVGQGSSGTLEFHNGSGVTLTVNGGLAVSSGAIFQAISTPTANRTHTLSLSGNLVNNGNIAFYYLYGSYTSVVNTTLAGSTAGSYSGSGNVQLNNLVQANSGGFSLGANLDLKGNFTVNSSRSFDVNGYTLIIAGSFSNSGTLTANASGSTLHFNGTAAQTLSGGTYTGSYIANVISSNTHASGLNLNVSSANSIGHITVNSNAYLQVANVVLNVKGNIVNNGSIFTNGGNGTTVLNINGSSQQTISGSGSFSQVTSNAGAGRFPRLTVDNAAGLVLNQDITLQNILNLTDGQISGTGTLTLGTGASSTLAVTRLEGSIGATTAYALSNLTYNLIYGNSSGSIPAITTGSELPASISGVLTFKNPNGVSLGSSTAITSGSNGLVLTGTVLTLGSYDLTLGTNTTISGTTSASNMIVTDGSGQLKKTYKTGATSFTFPVGDAGGHYSRAVVNLASNSVERVIGIRVVNSAHSQNGSVSDFINRYWVFSDNQVGTGTYTFNSGGLSFGYSTVSPSDVNGTVANYKINRWDGSGWTQLSSSHSAPNVSSSAAYNQTSATLGGNEFTLRLNGANSYTWQATSGTADFADPANWSPQRFATDPSDILLFSSGGSSTATGLTTQTVRQIAISNNTAITFQAFATSTLTLGSTSGATALGIESGSAMNLGGSNALTLSFANLSLITSIAGDLSVGSGNTINFANLSSANNTISGKLINGGGTITATAANTKIHSGATLEHNRDGGTIPPLTWDAASTLKITSSTTPPSAGLNQSFGHVKLLTGAFTSFLNGNTTINGDLELGNDAVLGISNRTLTLKGFLSGSGQLAGGSSSVLILNPSANGSIGSLAFASGSQTLSAFTVNLTGTSPTISLGSDLTVNGTFTLTDGDFSIGANNLTLRGAVTATSGTLTGGSSSDLSFDNTGSTTLSAVSGGLNNLTVNRSGSTISLGAPLSLSGNLAVNAGTLNDNGHQISGNGTGTLLVDIGTTLSLGNGTSATLFPTDYITANISLASNSTVIYTSTSTSGATVSNTPTTYGNLTLNGSAIKTFMGNTTLTGNFSNGSGSRPDIGAYTLQVAGTWINSGTITANAAGAVIELNGSGAQTFFPGTFTGSTISTLLITNSHASGVTLGANTSTTDISIAASSHLNVAGRTLSIAGTFTNSGGLTANATGATLTFNGSTAQSLDIGSYTGNVLTNFTLNNAAGLSLDAPLTVGNSSNGTLTLTSGVLSTTATNLLSIGNTATGAISGGSSTTYINGPLARTLPASLSGSSTYNFPVGKGSYTPFALVNAATSASGTVTAEVFDADIAASGATPGAGMATLNSNRYWKAEPSSSFITAATVRFTEPAMSGANRIAQSASANGSFDTKGGGTSSPVTSTTVDPSLGYFALGNSGQIFSSATLLSPQLSTTIVAGAVNEQILRIAVVVSNPASPALELKSLTFNTNGTTDVSDIASAKVFYTGTSSTYSTSTQFGSALSNPSGSHSITGSQSLSVGTNYFWLAFDIASTAPIGNRIDGECTLLNIGGASYPPAVDYTPTVTAPIGDRRVDLDYCIPNLTTACHDVWSNPATISSVSITDNSAGNYFQYSGTCSTAHQDLSGSNFNGVDAPLVAGQTYTISGVRTGSNSAIIGVWIDWNGNGSLSDEGEYILSSSQTGANFSGTFTVPGSVVQGPLRMRVGINLYQLSSTTDPCYTDVGLAALISGGEFKDFTLDVEGVDTSTYFRSRQSGNWNEATSWEASGDSVSWHTANTWPGEGALSILIREDDTISLSTGYDSLVIRGHLHIQGRLNYDNLATTVVVFTGVSSTTINLSDTLFVERMVLNKGDSAHVYLSGQIVIRDSLTFHKGIIYPDYLSQILFGETAVAYGANDSSYVNGSVVKSGAQTFVFPIGENQRYVPLGIEEPSSFSVFSARYHAEDPDSLYPRNQHALIGGYVNKCDYWVLERLIGDNTPRVTLSWKDNICYPIEPADARIAIWPITLSSWQEIETDSFSGTFNDGLVRTSVEVLENKIIFSLVSNCNNSVTLLSNYDNFYPNELQAFRIKDNSNWLSINYYVNDSLAQSSNDTLFRSYSLKQNDTIIVKVIDSSFCVLTDSKIVNYTTDRSLCHSLELLGNSGNICSCNGFYLDVPGEFPTNSRYLYRQETYIPRNISAIPNPTKKIGINVIIPQRLGSNPGNFENISEHREFLNRLFQTDPQFSLRKGYLNSNNCWGPNGQIRMVLPENEIYDHRVEFYVKQLIFIKVENEIFDASYGSSSAILSLLDLVENEYGCDIRNEFNYFFVDDLGPSLDALGAWGYAIPPSCNKTYMQYAVSQEMFLRYLLNINSGGDVYSSYVHIVHEIAHCFGLRHTYNDCNADGDSNNFDYLQDVYGPDIYANDVYFCNSQVWNDNLSNELRINNIMSGKFDNAYISPLQSGRIQRNLYLSSMAKYVDECPYSEDDILIENEQVWDLDIRVYSDIRITREGKLTVKCKISFPDDASIIVEPGGQLIIDHGTLTSSCTMWRGVQLLGNASRPQGTTIDPSNGQGIVEMDEGTIENAEEGIYVGGFGTDYLKKTGGIIHAVNSTFKNNWRSVAFNPYKYDNALTSFTNCHFICDAHLKKPDYFVNGEWQGSKAFVSIWGARYLRFYDNTFENAIQYDVTSNCSTTEYSFSELNRGSGITTWDANPILIATNPGTGTSGSRNKFIGLTYGLEIRKTFGNTYYMRSNASVFENCQFGIYSENSSSDRIEYNKFLIPATSQATLSTIRPAGIYQNNYQNFGISRNEFYLLPSSAETFNWGLVTSSQRANRPSGRVNRNTFTNLKRGYQAERDNPYISLTCNEFDHNAFEWHINPLNEGVFANQGTGCLTGEFRPGNYFLDAETYHIWSQNANRWHYFFRGVAGLEDPKFANSPLYGTGDLCSGTLPDPCPSGVGARYSEDLNAIRREQKAAMDTLAAQLINMTDTLDGGIMDSLLNYISINEFDNSLLTPILVNHSPLSDTILIDLLYNRNPMVSDTQLLDIMSRNLPGSEPVMDALEAAFITYSYLQSTRDSINTLQGYNPYFVTPTQLTRAYSYHEGAWLQSIYDIEADLLDYADDTGLIAFYRDTLGAGFERNLIAACFGADTLELVLARAALDAMPQITYDDSLFAEYHTMLIDLMEDSLGWKDLDSVGRARIHAIALEPSSIQSYALAALTLRGDTTLVNLPEYSEPSSGRYAEKQAVIAFKPKEQVSFSIFPNPNTGQFTLQFGSSSPKATKVTISDLTGRIVYIEDISGKNIVVFNLDYLAKGMYFCSVFQANIRLGTQQLLINK